MIDFVVTCKKQLRDGHDLISLSQKVFDNVRQCLRRVLRGIVEENDASRNDIRRDPLTDLVRADALPVERIAIRYKGNTCDGNASGDASSSELPSHIVALGGRDMKITNKHPVYATVMEREQRLTDLKALCREKISARKAAESKES